MSEFIALDAEPIAPEWDVKPPTVLQLAPRLGHNGVTRTIYEVAAALTALGGRSLIAGRSASSSPRLRTAGASIHDLDLTVVSPLKVRSAVRELASLARAENVGVIHAKSPASALIGLRAAEAVGAAFVTTWGEPFAPGGFIERAQRRALAAGAPIIAPSHFMADWLISTQGIEPQRVVAIPRGADMAVFADEAVSPGRVIQVADALGLAEDSRDVVLTAGELAPGRGHETMIEAAARLKALRGSDFVCVFVGEGDARRIAALDGMIAAAGVGDVVRICGPTIDMPAAIKLAAVFAAPAEVPPASSRTLVEAQAMGRPVIAANHGAAPEAVRDGQTGWLTPPRDTDAVAAAMNAALSMDESARAHLGLAGRAQVRTRFMLSATLSALMDVYRRAAAPNR